MKPKVSIVVPIYNVEKFLSRCMDSLLSQSLTDIEIIAVNDGSTDSSGEILHKYAKRDSRVKVLDKKNGGVSSARNTGLSIACGKFIGFVDPDDWIDPEMYETMYYTAYKEKADIVMCSYIREFGTHSKVKEFNIAEFERFNNDELKSKILRRLVGPLHDEIANPEMLDSWGTVWSKLYRSEILKGKDLSFTDLSEIGTNEDSLFNIEALYYANSFYFINKPFYHYWRANDSSVTSRYKPQLLYQYINLFQKIEEFIKKHQLGNEFLIALNNRICLNTLGLGLNTISRGNKTSSIRKVKKLKEILNHNMIRRSFIPLEMSHFPIVWKAFYFCAKIRFASGFYFLLLSIDILRRTMR
jgi:glycosyltransferase involved in cell wall biosynthesis